MPVRLQVLAAIADHREHEQAQMLSGTVHSALASQNIGYILNAPD